MGRLLHKQGKNDEALKYLDQAIKDRPENPSSYCYRAQVYNAISKSDLAL